MARAGKVYIDTVTGVWGDPAHLRIVDLDVIADRDTKAGMGTDGFSMLSFLEDASSSHIVGFGLTEGTPLPE